MQMSGSSCVCEKKFSVHWDNCSPKYDGVVFCSTAILLHNNFATATHAATFVRGLAFLGCGVKHSVDDADSLQCRKGRKKLYIRIVY